MAREKTSDSNDGEYPTADGMKRWLDREITDVQRAADLRIRDATRFVTAYALEEITADEAARLNYEYEQRWGPPLPGGFRSAGLTDTDILAKIDEARSPDHLDRLLSGRLRNDFSLKKS